MRAQLARRQIRNQPNEFGAWLGSEAADGDRFELFRERGNIAGMRVAETCDRHAGVQVQIRVSIEIGQRRSGSARNRQFREQRDRLQSGRDELMFFIEKRFGPRLRTRWSFTQHGHAS